MLFARSHQLMITTQADDSDASGRSNYDGSLNINLSQMEAISADPSNSTRSQWGEVTAQPGAVWEDVLQLARTFNRDVVTPNRFKSAVGDTVGDGGIGPLVRIHGFVEDNLLEVQMVLADGSRVTVTENHITQIFENNITSRRYAHDLFAAVTGGGRGPWGIVTSYTFKMFQAPGRIVHARHVYNLWEKGDYVGENVIQELATILPAMPAKWGGYFYLSGDTSDQSPDTKGTLVLDLVYYGLFKEDGDYDFINDVIGINSVMSLQSSIIVNRTSILEHQRQTLDDHAFLDSRGYTFSRLLHNNGTDKEPEQLTEALLFALNNPTIESTYSCTGQILGGASSSEPRLVSMTNPYLRSAAVNLYCKLSYPGRGIDDTFYISHAMDFKRLLEPFGEGQHRYWAEDDVVGWKKVFHGDKYGALIKTKLSYDVDNYLWCHNCVGSDFQVRCDRQKQESSEGLLMGGLLSGYVSEKRYISIRSRERMRSAHRERLVYINQQY